MHYDNIRKFNKTFGLPVNAKPTNYLGTDEAMAERLERFKQILTDEVNEVNDIIALLKTPNSDKVQIMTMLADWLTDVQVYAASEQIKFGLSPEICMAIVMESNFSKLDENGKAIIKDGKVQKGPNYWKPEPLLSAFITGEQKEWEALKPHERQALGKIVEGQLLTHFAALEEAFSKATHDGNIGLNALVGEQVPTANDRQVGGGHYGGGKLQHWDLVDIFGWDYFQGQITKYVMRWRQKNGLQDLQKAAHFLEKYIEVEGQKPKKPSVNMAVDMSREKIVGVIVGAGEWPWETKTTHGVNPQKGYDEATGKFNAMDALSMDQGGNEHWQNEGFYGDGTCLYACRQCKSTTRATAAPVGKHYSCPGPLHAAAERSKAQR